jgi:hypothetical protein
VPAGVPLNTSHVSFWTGPARRLVVNAKSGPKGGGDMKHTHRQIKQPVQTAREQAIISYVYGKRG